MNQSAGTRKKQNCVETSTFDNEFIAMKQSCEHVRGLECELRMMGVACKGPDYSHADDLPVFANTTVLMPTLKKKYSSLACHLAREGVAIDD